MHFFYERKHFFNDSLVSDVVFSEVNDRVVVFLKVSTVVDVWNYKTLLI